MLKGLRGAITKLERLDDLFMGGDTIKNLDDLIFNKK